MGEIRGCGRKQWKLSALFFVVSFFSCAFSHVEQSSLFLDFDGKSYGVLALNKNAVFSAIKDDAKSPYLYYLFDESFMSGFYHGENQHDAKPVSLEIAIQIDSESQPDANSDDVFLFGFLFETDFEKPADKNNPRLKKALDSRPLARVTGDGMRAEADTISLALAFPHLDARAPVGFFCYAPFPVFVPHAKIVPSQIGFDESIPRLSFPARGGSAAELISSEVRGVLSPVTADPDLLLSRIMPSWRSSGYEIFAWKQFPNILFFDTKDYAIQDAFFKRLAFFAEKKDYRGTLVPDSIMANQHGFNAHDYRAETLAAFFSLAKKEQFALNTYEKLLCEILIANYIIIEDGNGFGAGEGAVISISQESPDYLRRQFIVHEGLHGLYFTHEEFRVFVDQIYKETDPLCREFLEHYFDVTPSLAYDISDTYLLHNEFMAYILQQPVREVSYYFSERIANYIYINRYYPALAKYVRDTRARGFVETAQKLSDYLYRTWGLEAGRVWQLEN